MSSWLDDYLGAIELRDSREQANANVIDAYTKLADHAASLYKTPSQAPSKTQSPTQSPTPKAVLPFGSKASPKPTEDLATIRIDLLAAQRSRSTLTAEVATLRTQLSALQLQVDKSDATLGTLHAQKAILERRLRDRDSELKEKRKMLEHVQDEVLGLEMQVNVAEADRERVRRENEELVKRLVGEAKERERGMDSGDAV